jgi:hypothetical protein
MYASQQDKHSPQVGLSENVFLKGLQGTGLIIDVEVIRALPRSAAAERSDQHGTIRARS